MGPSDKCGQCVRTKERDRDQRTEKSHSGMGTRALFHLGYSLECGTIRVEHIGTAWNGVLQDVVGSITGTRAAAHDFIPDRRGERSSPIVPFSKQLESLFGFPLFAEEGLSKNMSLFISFAARALVFSASDPTFLSSPSSVFAKKGVDPTKMGEWKSKKVNGAMTTIRVVKYGI